MTASDRSGRRTQQRKFFLKKRQDLQVLLRNREGDEAEVEAAID